MKLSVRAFHKCTYITAATSDRHSIYSLLLLAEFCYHDVVPPRSLQSNYLFCLLICNEIEMRNVPQTAHCTGTLPGKEENKLKGWTVECKLCRFYFLVSSKGP